MMDVLRWFRFGVGDYASWLLVLSAFCFALERLFPWRRQQRALRRGFLQDLGWLCLNGHILGVVFWKGKAWLWAVTGLDPFFQRLESLNWLTQAPLAVQFIALLVIKDLLDWCIHNLLHRVGWLWELHKVHHSIEELDWAGNFRFHWTETVVYNFLTYLPMAVLGFRGEVVLPVAVVATLIGHLNHSNLPISWGPLRYVLNSPKFHVWHHDVLVRGEHGRNFGVVFSVWDWLFGTAEMPEGQPAKLGFENLEAFPRSLAARLAYPFGRLFSRPPARAAPSPGRAG